MGVLSNESLVRLMACCGFLLLITEAEVLISALLSGSCPAVRHTNRKAICASSKENTINLRKVLKTMEKKVWEGEETSHRPEPSFSASLLVCHNQITKTFSLDFGVCKNPTVHAVARLQADWT